MKVRSFPRFADLSCERVRLAEGDVAATDAAALAPNPDPWSES